MEVIVAKAREALQIVITRIQVLHLLAEISRTTICNLIPLSTSSSEPHKDIDDFVRLHVVVGLVPT